MDENKIRTFFVKLEQALRGEFMPQNYGNLEILNNYVIKKHYNLCMNLTLKCGIRVSVVCDMNFPTKSGPKIYLTEYLESPIVNKLTLELSYESFYLWSGINCKVTDLLIKLDLYFQMNPPKLNKSLSEVNLIYRDLQNATTYKLMNTDFSAMVPYLRPEDLAKSSDPNELALLLKNSTEYRECNLKLSKLAQKGIDIAGDVIRRSSDEVNND